MIPYIVLIVLAFLCALTDVVKTKNKIIVLLPFFLYAFGIVAFRDHLGGSDYYMYESFYSRIVPIKDYLNGLYEPFFKAKSFEEGFVILSSIIKTIDFTDGPFFLMFIVALLNFCIFFPSIREYTPFVMIAIFFFMYKAFFWHEFTLLRQSIAISLFTYSIRFIKSGDHIKYIIINLLGMSFHTSAIILLPLSFILNKQISIRTILILVGVSFLVSLLSPFLWKLCVHIASFFGFSQRLLEYDMNMKIINPLNFLEIISILALSLFFRQYYTQKEPYFNIFLNMFLFSSVLVIALSSFEIFTRLKEYFVISYMVLISYFVGHAANSRSKMAAFCICSLYVFMGYIRYLFTFDAGGLIPYKWILW